MSDKKRIKEALEKGAFESPINGEKGPMIACSKFIPKDRDFEIVVGQDLIGNLGTDMSIAAHDTIAREAEKGESR